MTDRSWHNIYEKRRSSLSRALQAVKRGAKVFLGTACAEPQHLVQGLIDSADRLHDVQILHFVTIGDAPYTAKRFEPRFRHNAFFIGPNTREAVNEARADYTPVFISEIPGLFRRGLVPIDVALIQTTPPDAHGYVSLGISVDIVKSAVESARCVIAQVNRHMPRTRGESHIHVSKIHHFVEYDSPLPEFRYRGLDTVGDKIAANAARLINDGDTVHFGFGHITYGVAGHLSHRSDLGIHTEVVSDAIIDLMESGVITGEKKSLHPGKVVCSFCIGSREMYEYVDENPAFRFYPADYVYHPMTIARNSNMVSLGSALEADLSGQICSESLGYHFYSGVGGRLDFIRGAAMAEGGRSVICLPSTTRDGEQSRIRPQLQEGAGVVATRGDVQYVVTEFGIAYLHGKSVRERAMALINIAHPKFRPALLEEAKRRAYVYPDQVLVQAEITDVQLQAEETTSTLADGTRINIRPIRPTDEPLLQDFFYSHSDETIYRRYFRSVRAMSHATAQTMVNVDYRDRMAFVATIGDIGMERIIGVGRYAKEKDRPGLVEVAYTVHEDYQGRGLGSVLQKNLERHAQRMGFGGVSGYLFSDNVPMLRVFGHSGDYEAENTEDGVLRVTRWFKRKDGQAPS